jgi:hypothetical protein
MKEDNKKLSKSNNITSIILELPNSKKLLFLIIFIVILIIAIVIYNKLKPEPETLGDIILNIINKIVRYFLSLVNL